MKIFKDEGCYVCLIDCYMYNAPTLIALFCVMIKEWRSDKNLIG